MALNDLALVGFSQGGMLALEMMFVCLGVKGIVSYSGAFYPPGMPRKCSPETRALLVHGDQDTVVPYTALNETRHYLEKSGLAPQILTCRGVGHGISREGMDCGGKFVGSIFAEN